MAAPAAETGFRRQAGIVREGSSPDGRDGALVTSKPRRRRTARARGGRSFGGRLEPGPDVAERRRGHAQKDPHGFFPLNARHRLLNHPAECVADREGSGSGAPMPYDGDDRNWDDDWEPPRETITHYHPSLPFIDIEQIRYADARPGDEKFED